MQSIKVGTLSGGHEVIINNGSVQQVDTQGIKATWKGVDSQSGILGYQVAIGNTSGLYIYRNEGIHVLVFILQLCEFGSNKLQ